MKIEYNCFLTCFKSMKKSKKVDDLWCHVDKFRMPFKYFKYNSSEKKTLWYLSKLQFILHESGNKNCLGK